MSDRAARVPQVAPANAPPAPARSPGVPLEREVRREMEARLGFDFGSVRIHADKEAAESARGVNALAYTIGSDVCFGAGQYEPHTRPGRHLLAHELTHTVQQRSGLTLQRQDASGGAPADAAEMEADRAADAAAGGFLVRDDAQPGSGQMRKTEFLDELQRASCEAADAELARVGRSTDGCPYVERAFTRYRAMPAAQVETSIRRYVDPSGVTGARDYIPLVSRRVAEGVSRWATTGDMSGVPAELAGEAMGGAGGVLGMLGGGLADLAGIGRLMFKREGGGEATPAEAAMVSARLGGGAPLESGVRGRMESAFGYDFSRVRIHAGETAASVSSSLGARAFTLGSDIGFGGGEYRPNTLAGDALIAHELAHVVQQSSGAGAGGAVEEDADHSAVSAVMAVWTGAKQVTRGAMPRLRSGLGLQRCGGTPARPTTPAGPTTSAGPTTPGAAPRLASTTIDHAQFSTAAAAARALTDPAAKAAAMTTLVQQALAELNLTVRQAGTSDTSVTVPADYSPTPVINFDVYLNDKRTRPTGGRSLRRNAGYSFNRGGPPNYSILGPKVLEHGRVFDVRFFAEHELDVASGLTSSGGVSTADEELRVWTNDFRRYFYQSLDVPLSAGRPSFTNLAVYYQAATATARAATVQALVDLYQNPPTGVDATRVRGGLRNWMRLRTTIQIPDEMNGVPESMLGQELQSQLVIDLTAALPPASP